MPSSRYDGPFTKTIVVTSNDPEHGTEKLTCTGRVMQPMKIEPAANVNFGNIKRDSGPQYRFVTIRRGDGGPIAPEVLPGTLPGLSAQMCAIVPGEEYELEVWIGPPWPEGKIRDTLRLTTGVDEAPETGLAITGEIVARLTAVPNRLTFPTEQTEEIVRSVRLNWDDGKPANVLEATSSIADAQVRIEQDEKAQTVVVTIPAGSERLAGSHEVTIKTDDPAVPKFSIPIAFTPKAGLPRPAANQPQRTGAGAKPAPSTGGSTPGKP
jgi:hypothetical protein